MLQLWAYFNLWCGYTTALRLRLHDANTCPGSVQTNGTGGNGCQSATNRDKWLVGQDLDMIESRKKPRRLVEEDWMRLVWIPSHCDRGQL